MCCPRDAQSDVESAFEHVRAGLAEVDGILCGVVSLELDQKALRDLAARVKTLAVDLAVLLLGGAEAKIPWIALCQGAARTRGFDARNAAAFLRAHLGGGGGGRPELAQGQGDDSDGREVALAALTDAPLDAFRPSADAPGAR